MKRITVLQLLVKLCRELLPTQALGVTPNATRNVLRSLAVLFVLSLTVWGLVPSEAEGAVPQLINFQGVLRQPGGNPVADGSYSVTFTIYDAPSAGNNFWSETQSVTTSNGLFAVLLGASNPIPDTVFVGSNRWLGIAVAPDGEMPQRQRLASVGYSYRVNSVDGAAGGTINGAIDAPGMNSKIRFHYDQLGDLPSPSTYHGMFAHVHSQEKAYFAHAGAWVPLANELHNHSSLAASDGFPNPALSVDTSGKVGIGVSNPLNTLTIGSNGAWTSTGLFPGILMGTTDFQTKQILIGRDEGNFVQLAYADEDPSTAARLLVEGNHPLSVSTGGPLYLFGGSLDLSTGGTNRVFVSNGGNVGVGTTSPAYPLHVQKSSANIFATSIENQDPTGWGLEIRTADVSAARNALEIYTGGFSKFLVRNDGNVGIGTTGPGASNLLELSSTTKGFVLPRMTKAQRDAIVAPVAGMMVYQTDNTPGLRVYNGTNWMRFTETAD